MTSVTDFGNNYHNSTSKIATATDGFDYRDYIDQLTPAKEKGKYICPVCQKNDLTISPDGKHIKCWSGDCNWQDIRNTIAHWEPKRGSDKILPFSRRPNGKQPRKLKPAPLPESIKLARMEPQATPQPHPLSYGTKVKVIPVGAIVKEIVFPYSESQIVKRFEWEDSTNPKGRAKTYQQWHKNANGDFVAGKGSEPWLAYRLNEAIAVALESSANAILAQEGEPCIETARSLGFPSITWQGSAWSDNDLKSACYALNKNGLTLVYLPDPDEQGLKKARDIETVCAQTQTPFICLDPARLWQGFGLSLPHPKADLVDLVAAVTCMTGDDLINALMEQINEAIAITANTDDDELEDGGGSGGGNSSGKPRTELEAKFKKVRDALGHRLRWNQLLMQIELDGEPMDTDFARLGLALNAGVELGDGDSIACLTTIAKESPYHPVRDYLNACHEQYSTDTTILDGLAERYFGASDPLHQAYITKHLIASCKRAFEPGEKNDAILVLQSQRQGINKSTFLKVLHGKEFFTDSMQGLDRDGLMVASQYWCIEIAEIDGVFTKKESAELKAFLSRDTDTFRLPYGRRTQKYPRGFVLAGTTNNGEFLKDETGNRRFMVLPVKVPKIPLDLLAQERDRIWGAAMALYRAGVPHWLSEEEIALQASANLAFSSVDPWEDLIIPALDGLNFIPTQKILSDLLGLEPGKQSPREGARIKSIMVKHGWKASQKRLDRGTTVRGYKCPEAVEAVNASPLLQPESLQDKGCSSEAVEAVKLETSQPKQVTTENQILSPTHSVESVKDVGLTASTASTQPQQGFQPEAVDENATASTASKPLKAGDTAKIVGFVLDGGTPSMWDGRTVLIASVTGSGCGVEWRDGQIKQIGTVPVEFLVPLNEGLGNV